LQLEQLSSMVITPKIANGIEYNKIPFIIIIIIGAIIASIIASVLLLLLLLLLLCYDNY
jgi:hypothetical protein